MKDKMSLWSVGLVDMFNNMYLGYTHVPGGYDGTNNGAEKEEEEM